ncbi:MAG: hypothetical protein M1815_000128 [Lichina confinis]|nr:MAG: hypothetical protein M1815_000128 [Lichina confinis]
MADFEQPGFLRELYLSLLDFSSGLDAQSDQTVQDADNLASIFRAGAQAFARLLDKPPKSDESRRQVMSGKVNIDDVEYSLNDEFKQNTIQLADNLDLDELKAAELILQAQADTEILDRSALAVAHINFHSHRKNTLGCLRLILTLAIDDDNGDKVVSKLRRAISAVANAASGGSGDRFALGRKCLNGMSDLRRWITAIEEKLQGASIIGLGEVPEYVETLEFQITSLAMQCEDLGVVLHHLAKLGYTDVSCFENLLATVKAADKYDSILVFYIPFYMVSISRLASSEEQGSFAVARSLYEKITNSAQADSWTLRYLRAATIFWWLAEYSGWFIEPHEQVTAAKLDAEAEAEAQSKLFVASLKDGAFDFILSLCGDVRSTESTDPLRSSLHQWLQRKAPALLANSVQFSDEFRLTLSEQLETSVDAFITNMPGNLRRLRLEHDESSRIRLLQADPDQQELDLEKFLLIISYIFENRPDAARAFWSYPDANWYGFLQWSLKRLTTPRACAVCEMLISLSQGEGNAAAAHQFLLDEGSSSKSRRAPSLGWAPILRELRYAAEETVSATGQPQRAHDRRARAPQSVKEPEFYQMLESYLRLTAKVAGDCPAAQSWFISQDVPPVETFLLLCSGPTPSRLRACAFESIRALAYQQSAANRGRFWFVIDSWIAEGPKAPDKSKNAVTALVPLWSAEMILERIAQGYEESLSFVNLLTTLLIPAEAEGPLNDSLPFPESLGSAYRMPGVEPYVDFVLGRVFAGWTQELQDVQQQRFLRLRCLDFLAVCLRGFNESLIIFANQSTVVVDSAIKASSLATYTKIHPFARAMDWLFNDNLLRVLFETARQDPQEVAKAQPESLLVLSVLRSIEVMLMVLSMQATHFDVVRPVVRSQSGARSAQVANNTYSSFEEVILQNLQFTVNLGVYATTEHPALVAASLALLERLVVSPKVTSLDVKDHRHRTGQSKMLGIFEVNDEGARIGNSLVHQMLPDSREAKKGPASPAYAIKISILSFLQHCLESLPARPNLAHRLLGFTCAGDSIEVDPNGGLAHGHSLFHAVVNIVVHYPSSDGFGLQSWLYAIRKMAFEVLRVLWTSPLSAVYAMTELRAHGFLYGQLANQTVITVDTMFDGRTLTDPSFLMSEAALCCNQCLRERSRLLGYAAAELKLLAEERAPTLKAQTVSALLGRTVLDDGQTTVNPSIFELFDFSEIELGDEVARPRFGLFGDLDLEFCTQRSAVGHDISDLESVEQLLTLRLNHALKTVEVSIADEKTVRSELLRSIEQLRARNHQTLLLISKLATLKAWCQLLVLIVEVGGLEADIKAAFVLRTLQLILPKLEHFTLHHAAEAVELARVAKTILFNIDLESASFGRGQAGDVAADRLYQLFLVSLRGIHSPSSNPELREMFYIICHRYSVHLAERQDGVGSLSSHLIRAISNAGEALMETVCEDAHVGPGTSSICALLFFDGLLLLSQRDGSSYVMDSLVRMNFLSLAIETIKRIPADLQITAAQDVPMLLSYYDTILSLLLRLAQTRLGATHLFEAGIFQCMRESGLFSVDPDVGIEMDDPNALSKYYRMLLATLRIVTSVVMSCGPQNPRTIKEARNLLLENRASMSTAFKRQAKIGGIRVDNVGELGDIVKHYVLLITATDFLKYEEGQDAARTSVFTQFT